MNSLLKSQRQYPVCVSGSNRLCARRNERVSRCVNQRVPRQQILRVSAVSDGYKVLVVGGGSAGAAVAAHYGRKLGKQVAVVEAADVHYYQPLWTLVGGGIRQLQDSARPEADVLSKDVEWLKTSVSEFRPDSNSVITADGRKLQYEYMVVATGMEPKWQSVKGLSSALGDGRVVSNFSPKYAPMTFQALQNLKQGDAVFTVPRGPMKCPGASHKACWLSEDYLRREGRRSKRNPGQNVTVTLVIPGAKVVGLQHYAPTIDALSQQRDINVVTNSVLVEVRGKQQQAVFNSLGPDGQATGQQVMHYDLLHVTPAHGPIQAVAQSALANAEGWVAVDKETLQHVTYPNVFAIGDCAALPTSKTAAAVAAQFLVLRDNLDALMAGQPAAAASYDGYTSCPVVTAKGKVMLMEFGYEGKIMEMFTPFGIDQRREQYAMWLVKTLVLPNAYWNLMVKGYVPWREVPRMLERAVKAAGLKWQ